MLLVVQHFLQSGHLLLNDAVEQLSFGMAQFISIVVVDFDEPELLQPGLFLHFTFEEAELRHKAELGECAVFLVEVRGFWIALIWLGALFDAPAFVVVNLGLRFFVGVVFFLNLRFHRH